MQRHLPKRTFLKTIPNPTCAEEDDEDEEKEQSVDFTIKVESDGEGKSVIAID